MIRRTSVNSGIDFCELGGLECSYQNTLMFRELKLIFFSDKNFIFLLVDASDRHHHHQIFFNFTFLIDKYIFVTLNSRAVVLQAQIQQSLNFFCIESRSFSFKCVKRIIWINECVESTSISVGFVILSGSLYPIGAANSS